MLRRRRYGGRIAAIVMEFTMQAGDNAMTYVGFAAP
jgi:hypothetical protein